MTQDVHVKLIQNYYGKSRIENGKKSFHQKTGLKFKRKLLKFYTLNITLCGTETKTLRKIDQKYLSIESGAGEGWRRSHGPIVFEMKKYCKASSMAVRSACNEKKKN